MSKIKEGSKVNVVKGDSEQRLKDISPDQGFIKGDSLIVHSITKEGNKTFVWDMGGHGIDIDQVELAEE